MVERRAMRVSLDNRGSEVCSYFICTCVERTFDRSFLFCFDGVFIVCHSCTCTCIYMSLSLLLSDFYMYVRGACVHVCVYVCVYVCVCACDFSSTWKLSFSVPVDSHMLMNNSIVY